MKYIIWGTGPYCEDKLNWGRVDPKEIIGFADRTKKEFQGMQTILLEELTRYEFDYIIIMSSHYLDIIPDIINAGISSRKIILGMIYRPYIGEELLLMPHNKEIIVLKDGGICFEYDDGYTAEVHNRDDMEDLKKHLNKIQNVNYIRKLDVNPVGKLFGHDRGKSICRYYIEKFLRKYSTDIWGNVLEIGENFYINKYGDKNVKPHILYYGKENSEYSENGIIYGDLETDTNIPSSYFDCMILTQVLDFIYDVNSTVRTIKKSLKKGGVALLTVSGISPISRSDMDRYGHYWNFTIKSLEKLFMDPSFEVRVVNYGNCKSACAFLQGMAAEDLLQDELDMVDDDFQVVIAARVERLV